MTKSKRLTDAICRDLPRLDKRYFKPLKEIKIILNVKTTIEKMFAFLNFDTKFPKEL